MNKLVEQILENEKIKYKKLKKSSSGFTNIVYFIDDNYVIKLTNDEEIKKQLEKEIYIYQNVKIKNIPCFIASGEINEFKYLIISKLKGVGLYSVWHKLSMLEREDCVKQISSILKDFNKIMPNFMPAKFCYHNWKCHIIDILEDRMRELDDIGEDSSVIKDLIKNDCMGVFDENIMGLVYNDAHFDNFLYNIETKKLSLIDFDRVIYGAIDYEMLIFKTMCDNPLKFASEEDENVVFEEDFKEVYTWLKRYYSELFNNENIESRIRIYQFNYLLEQAIKWKNPKAKEWRAKLMQDAKHLFEDGYVLTTSV